MTDGAAGLSLSEAAAAVRAGRLSATELTRACLDRIERLDLRVNAYLAVDAETSLARATAADRARAAGEPLGPLHGVPLAHKDMFYRAGEVCTCGSRSRAGWVADRTAAVLARLNAAGAVTLGRLGMSEFAVGPLGLNAHYGAVRNPWNLERVSGGSSSGPAAAVAAGLCFGALGSDTGASIRVPAAACGVVGLKPTYGLVSRAGAMPLSYRLDVVGPIARTVADVALLTSVISGPDADDPASLVSPAGLVPAVPPPLPNGLRVAVPTSFFTDDLDRECAEALAAAAEALRRLGCVLVPMPMAALAEATDLYPVILGPEAASVHGPWLRTRASDYAPQVRGRLLAGLRIPAHDYVTALRARAGLLARLKAEVFARADVILAPVWSRLPPRIADVEAEDVTAAARTVAGVLRAVAPTGTTVVILLGVMAGFLLKKPVAAGERDNTLRHAIVIPLTENGPRFHARFGSVVHTVFNMSDVSCPLVSGDNPTVVGSCSLPRNGVTVRPVDANDLPVPVGQIGELIIRTALPWQLNHGYEANPEATAAARRNGWFHTGDAFRTDADSNYFFVDRFKDAIRRRGENISSYEVEREGCSHLDIREVAATAVASEHGEEEILIAISLTPGAALAPAELIDYLRPRMAHFTIPRYVRIMPDLPKTPTNKVEKYLVRRDGVTADTWDREAAGIIIKRDTIGG